MDPPPGSLLASTGYLLLKAGHHVGLELESALGALGLTIREFQVLSFARESEGLSQQDVSGRLGVDPTILVSLVDGLESRGWLKRARDPEDRRRNVLAVTPEGAALCQRAREAIATAEQRFMAPLDEGQRVQLRSLVHTLLRGRLPWLT